jgi:hypothetical protein
MRRIALILVLAGVVNMAGCMMRTLTLPNNFIRVDKAWQGDFALRGVSADGVVVGLRSEVNPEGGTLDFWTEAIGDQMTKGRGYKATGSEAVTSAGGTGGRLLSFSEERQGVVYTYLVAVYVQGPDILVAEAGGKAEAVAAHQDEIHKALLSVR